jgi:antitoxin component YwqK of YwqJK toxin-antitoxin module
MSFRLHNNNNNVNNVDSSLTGTENNVVTDNNHISIIDNSTEIKTVNLPTFSNEGKVKLITLKHVSGFDCIVQNKDGVVRLTGDYPTRKFTYTDGKWRTNVNSLYSYYPSRQQGDKMIPVNNISNITVFGVSTSISSDGNTVVIGGSSENVNEGAAWVYTRTEGLWSFKQKLVGTNLIGTASRQGVGVSISGDGNTIASGGYNDDGGIGATWIFTKIGTVWIEQQKLVGTGDVAVDQQQGRSVSLNYNGNVVAIGGWFANNKGGATWVFNRSGVNWTQVGNKLTGTGGTGELQTQGISVSLSSNGKTLAVGGYEDNGGKGAVWIFTETGGVWTQQGNKLIGNNSTNDAEQGYSVSLSSNGNVLAMGGPKDTNDNKGAVWIFNRSGETWTQQGEKITSVLAVVGTLFGISVALSANGKTLAIGSIHHNNLEGAVWMFTQSENIWSEQEILVGTGGDGNIISQGKVAINEDGSVIVSGASSDNIRTGAFWIFH